jgi:mono/diheme cytochrome c family protein
MSLIVRDKQFLMCKPIIMQLERRMTMTRIAAIIVCAVGLVLAVGQIEVGAKTGNAFLVAQQAPEKKTTPSTSVAQAQDKASTPTYADISQIIDKYHCTVCHGAVEPRAGLSLDSHKGMLKGGKDGPIIKAGEPDKSELIKRIKGTSEPRMPITGPPWLSDDEIETIERWIAAGAPESKK